MRSQTTTLPHSTNTPSGHEAAATGTQNLNTASHKTATKGKQAMRQPAVDDTAALQPQDPLHGIRQGAPDGALRFLQQ